MDIRGSVAEEATSLDGDWELVSEVGDGDGDGACGPPPAQDPYVPTSDSAAQAAFFAHIPLVARTLSHLARADIVRTLRVSRVFAAAGLPLVYACVHARDLDKVPDALARRYVRTAGIPMGFVREQRFRDVLVPRSVVVRALVYDSWEPEPRWCPALLAALQSGQHPVYKSPSRSQSPGDGWDSGSNSSNPNASSTANKGPTCPDPWFHMCTRYFASAFALAHFFDPVWAARARPWEFTLLVYALPWPGFWAVGAIDGVVAVVFDLVVAVAGCTERTVNIVGIGETDPFWESRLWAQRHERQARAEHEFLRLLDEYLDHYMYAPPRACTFSPREWLRTRIKARLRFVTFKTYLETDTARACDELGARVVGNWLNRCDELDAKEREEADGGKEVKG